MLPVTLLALLSAKKLFSTNQYLNEKTDGVRWINGYIAVFLSSWLFLACVFFFGLIFFSDDVVYVGHSFTLSYLKKSPMGTFHVTALFIIIISTLILLSLFLPYWKAFKNKTAISDKKLFFFSVLILAIYLFYYFVRDTSQKAIVSWSRGISITEHLIHTTRELSSPYFYRSPLMLTMFIITLIFSAVFVIRCNNSEISSENQSFE